MSESSDTTGRQATPVVGADGADGIGRRLAAHRARRGVRVAELARDVGVTPSLISQIERGQSRPSVSTLFALAEALRVPVDAFFRESAEPAEPAWGRTGNPRPRVHDDQARVPDTQAWLHDGQAQPPRAQAGPDRAVPPPRAQAGPDRAVPPPRAQAAPDQAVPRHEPPREEAVAGEAAGGSGRYLVRKDNRAAIDIEGGVRWERLTRNTMDHLDFFELIYQPGAESHPRQYTHPGTEMLLVMGGCLEITVGFERYRLGPGDSIDFPSSMPHRYVNPGDETARAVTVIFYECPAARDGKPGSGRPAP